MIYLRLSWAQMFYITEFRKQFMRLGWYRFKSRKRTNLLSNVTLVDALLRSRREDFAPYLSYKLS